MNPDLAQLQAELAALTERVNKFVRPDSFAFHKRVGFYDKSPISRFSSGIGRQDISSNTGIAMNVGAQFNGNSGATYYSIGDVVRALKDYGLLKQ